MYCCTLFYCKNQKTFVYSYWQKFRWFPSDCFYKQYRDNYSCYIFCLFVLNSCRWNLHVTRDLFFIIIKVTLKSGSKHLLLLSMKIFANYFFEIYFCISLIIRRLWPSFHRLFPFSLLCIAGSCSSFICLLSYLFSLFICMR